MTQKTLTIDEYNALLDQNRSVYVNQILDEQEGLRGPVLATEQDTTLYVRANGDDANDGLTTGNALATIGAALEKVPNLIRHKILIDIGEGNFPGIDISGFIIDQGQTLGSGGSTSAPRASLIISGTLGQPTLTTGTATGTADGGSTSQLVDSGQNWVVNELRGRLVLVGGAYRVVRDNTADTIEFCAVFGATCSGEAYEILEQKTVLNTGAGFYGYAVITIWDVLVSYRRCLAVENLKLDASATPYGLMTYGASGYIIRQCWVDKQSGSGQEAILVQNPLGETGYDEIYITGTWGIGMNLLWCAGPVRSVRAVVDGVSKTIGNGITMNGLAFDNVEVACIGCGYGMNLAGTWFIGNIQMNRGYFADSTNDGVRLGFPGAMEMQNVSGAGNGAFGVYNNSSTQLDIQAGMTVTGGSGALTINAGTNVHAWADLGSVGDIIKNEDTCAIVRRK